MKWLYGDVDPKPYECTTCGIPVHRLHQWSHLLGANARCRYDLMTRSILANLPKTVTPDVQ